MPDANAMMERMRKRMEARQRKLKNKGGGGPKKRKSQNKKRPSTNNLSTPKDDDDGGNDEPTTSNNGVNNDDDEVKEVEEKPKKKQVSDEDKKRLERRKKLPGDHKMLQIHNKRLRESRGDLELEGVDKAKIIVKMKQGDPVYFYSKNEKQYGPGTLDVEKKGGFWKVNKIVKIPEFAEDDDPSKYIRTKPMLIKLDGYYTLMSKRHFEIELTLAIAKIMMGRCNEVLKKRKKKQHYEKQKKRALERINTSKAVSIKKRPSNSKLDKSSGYDKMYNKPKGGKNDVAVSKEEREKHTNKDFKPKKKKKAGLGKPEKKKKYPKTFPSNPNVEEWDLNDVLQWLTFASNTKPNKHKDDKKFNKQDFIGEYYGNFSHQQMDGPKLLDMSPAKLANDLLIPNKHRQIILLYIRDLKRHQMDFKNGNLGGNNDNKKRHKKTKSTNAPRNTYLKRSPKHKTTRSIDVTNKPKSKTRGIRIVDRNKTQVDLRVQSTGQRWARAPKTSTNNNNYNNRNGRTKQKNRNGRNPRVEQTPEPKVRSKFSKEPDSDDDSSLDLSDIELSDDDDDGNNSSNVPYRVRMLRNRN